MRIIRHNLDVLHSLDNVKLSFHCFKLTPLVKYFYRKALTKSFINWLEVDYIDWLSVNK